MARSLIYSLPLLSPCPASCLGPSDPSPGPRQPHLASSSLVWSVRMALSAFTMQASAEMTPAFSSRLTRMSMKSFLSWGDKGDVGEGRGLGTSPICTGTKMVHF